MHAKVRVLSFCPFTAQATDFPASRAAGPIAMSLSIRLGSEVEIMASHWTAVGPFPFGDFKEISIDTGAPRDTTGEESRSVWACSVNPGKDPSNERKQRKRRRWVSLSAPEPLWFRRLPAEIPIPTRSEERRVGKECRSR